MKFFALRFLVVLLTFILGVWAVWFWFINSQMNRPINSTESEQTEYLTESAPLPQTIQLKFTPQNANKTPNRQLIPIEKHEDFDDVVLALKRLIPFMGKKGEQTFLISNVRFDDGEYAYAYWKQDNSVIILQFPFNGEPDKPRLYWLSGKARMDLKNVVSKGKYGNLGCCLIEQDFADKILSWCKKGYKLKIIGEKRKTEER